MGWAEGFIAVDWGTTNRRGYRLAADGALAGSFEDDQGILSVPSGGFPAFVQRGNTLDGKPVMLPGGN